MCRVIIIILFLGWNYNFYCWKNIELQFNARPNVRKRETEIYSSDGGVSYLLFTTPHTYDNSLFFILPLFYWCMLEIETCITFAFEYGYGYHYDFILSHLMTDTNISISIYISYTLLTVAKKKFICRSISMCYFFLTRQKKVYEFFSGDI